MGVLPPPWNRSASCRLVQGVPSVVERGVTERGAGRRSHCAATLGVIVSQAAKGSIRGLVFADSYSTWPLDKRSIACRRLRRRKGSRSNERRP